VLLYCGETRRPGRLLPATPPGRIADDAGQAGSRAGLSPFPDLFVIGRRELSGYHHDRRYPFGDVRWLGCRLAGDYGHGVDVAAGVEPKTQARKGTGPGRDENPRLWQQVLARYLEGRLLAPVVGEIEPGRLCSGRHANQAIRPAHFTAAHAAHHRLHAELRQAGAPDPRAALAALAIGLVSEGEDRGLDAVLQAEFGEDAADVGLDGLLADGQVLGDLPVAVTAGDQLEYFAFAR
jgi:hypothetical protein